jgi:hypothetical protein
MPKKLAKTTMYLDPVLWKRVKIEAAKRSMTATAIVHSALENWLRKGGR